MESFVEPSDLPRFKRWNENGFCRRNKLLQKWNLDASKSPLFYYIADESTIHHVDNAVKINLKNCNEENHSLSVTLFFYKDGIIRFLVEEIDSMRERFRASQYGVVEEDALQKSQIQITNNTDSLQIQELDSALETVIIIYYDNFRIEHRVNNELCTVINHNNLFNVERSRHKGNTYFYEHKIDSTFFEEERSTLFNDKFQKWEDHIDEGPLSIGVDFAFPNKKYLYGIPERINTLNLINTIGNDEEGPYRFYNIDHFDDKYKFQTTYGSIPFIMSCDPNTAVISGLLWLNASDTYIDIMSQMDGRTSHWISEAGAFEFMLFGATSPSQLFFNYAKATGFAPLPPLFSLGYHQCRWNYENEDDVLNLIDAKLIEHDIPCDAIWLDIEYTDGKRYFTWDKKRFPDPEKVVKVLEEHKRHLITIIDPHIKVDDDYILYKTAKNKGLFVKDKDGDDFEGICWPEKSSWLDFLKEETRNLWQSMYKYSNFEASTPNCHIWNDMNEPSVFDGPESTMPKFCKHFSSHENREVLHRECHNIYGIMHHGSTYKGLIDRNEDKNRRAFVLSRSFFAGTQKTSAVWTADCNSTWKDLNLVMPMLLSISISGVSFCGSDVAGFYGDPEDEVYIRWYQLGTFMPFFRAHANRNTKRREPWLYSEDENLLRITRNYVKMRYQLLTYIYTVFYEHHINAFPITRPMWTMWPKQESTYTCEDQFCFGDSLMIKPVLKSQQTKLDVLFPENEIWYDYFDMAPIDKSQKTIDVNMDKIGVFIRGGSIISLTNADNVQSTVDIRHKPYSIVVALDHNAQARGTLYTDDGETFDYKKGKCLYKEFKYADGVFTSTNITFSADYTPTNHIEELLILGVTEAEVKKDIKLQVKGSEEKSHELEAVYDAERRLMRVKIGGGISVNEEFSIILK